MFLFVFFLVRAHKICAVQEGGSITYPYQQRVSSPCCVNFLRRLLINRGNADHSGVMVSPKEELTVQQYDLQFGTNVIGKCLSFSG